MHELGPKFGSACSHFIVMYHQYTTLSIAEKVWNPYFLSLLVISAAKSPPDSVTIAPIVIHSGIICVNFSQNGIPV